MATVEQQVQDLLQATIEDIGFELVGIEYNRTGRYATLRIFIDKDGGINIDDCAVVSREISNILDVEDIIDCAYNLEVSSPGLDRPLFTLAHYEKFIGQDICIQLYVAVENKRKWQGKLISVNNDLIIMLVDEKEQVFAFANIKKANIVPKF